MAKRSRLERFKDMVRANPNMTYAMEQKAVRTFKRRQK